VNQVLILLKQLGKSPLVQAASTKVLAEVANHGIGGLYEKAIDTVAERIAQHIIDERIKKNEGDKDV
jgi:hypothetical protein